MGKVQQFIVLLVVFSVFLSRMGKVQQFVVLFDGQPVTSAGDTLRGAIFVDLKEPVKVQCIKLSLLGRGKVHWKKTKGSGDSRKTTHYRAEEIYFNTTVVLYGNSQGNAEYHPSGQHRMPFSFEIPPNCPSSFEGRYGYVRYSCTAIMDRPWKFNHETISAFTVINQLDLNNLPQLKAPLQGEQTTTVDCCCCVSGTVRAVFRIDKQAFVPGESIPIYAEIHNSSNAETVGSRCSLIQVVQFYGHSDSFFSSGVAKPKEVSDVMVEHTSSERIPPGQAEFWTDVALRVPSVPASQLMGCDIISISYLIQFRVMVECGSDIEISGNITLGTVPYRQEPVTQQPAAFGFTGAEPSAPPPYEAPPPSYEACVSGAVDISDDVESEYTMGDKQFTPIYPVYNYNTVYSAPSAPSPQVMENLPHWVPLVGITSGCGLVIY